MAKNSTFIKLDDTTPDHPKVDGLSNAAFRAWIDLMCQSVDDDGVVTPERFSQLPAGIQIELEPLIETDRTIFGLVGFKLGAKRRPPIPRAVRIEVFERDGWACISCDTTDDLTLDHIYPWSLGGSDDQENLQTLCRSCNSRKGASV
jgi:hypothetical protein